MDERNVGIRTLTRDALIYVKSTHVFDPDVVQVVIGFRPQKKQIDMFFPFSAFSQCLGMIFFSSSPSAYTLIEIVGLFLSKRLIWWTGEENLIQDKSMEFKCGR
jgi:hypothetical protein